MTMENNNVNEIVVEQKKRNPVAAALDKFFRISERGSTIGKEISAGISVFLVSVCVLLMQTRIIGQATNADNAGYTGIYLAATLISFIGTLVIGLVARLPLIQTSSLGLSTAFISYIGANNGLTYQNLLAISFISAILYTVLVSVPQIRKYVLQALPEPIRKALPVGLGLYVIFQALMDGAAINVTTDGVFTLVNPSEAGGGVVVYGLGIVTMFVTALVCFIFYKLKNRISTPVMFGLFVGIMFFYVGSLIVGFNFVFSVNRAYIALGAENMYTISAGFKGLEFGSVFTKGFDFSGYTGNVGQLFVYGILTYFLMSMYESTANVDAVSLANDVETDDKDLGLALICNAATNVAAPIVGAMPVTVAKQSSVAAHDGGKTGLSSVVASIGYILAMFTWILFALLATYTATVSDYGHATSNSYAEYAQATFAIVDGVMLFVGLMMMKGITKVDYKKIDEFIPFVATIAGIAFTQNIVFGVAAGVILWVVFKLLSFKLDEIKTISIPNAVLAVLLVLVLFLK